MLGWHRSGPERPAEQVWGMAVMLPRLMGVVVGLAVAGMATAANAVTLGMTTISFSASGSPNGIGGGWNAPGMTNSEGTLIEGTIEYFTYELTSLTSPFGRPQSISLESIFSPSTGGDINYCFNTSACLADTIVGAIGTVASPIPAVAARLSIHQEQSWSPLSASLPFFLQPPSHSQPPYPCSPRPLPGWAC